MHAPIKLARCRECETSPNVFQSQAREVTDDLLFRHAAGKIFEDIVDRDSRTSDAGLAAPNTRRNRDSILEFHENSVSHVMSIRNPLSTAREHERVDVQGLGHRLRLDGRGVGHLHRRHLELAAVAMRLHPSCGLLTALDVSHRTPPPSLAVGIHFIGGGTDEAQES